MSRSIQRELFVEQPPEKVWHALANRAALAEWMFPNDFEPRLGHRFTFQVPPNPQVGFDGMSVQCEVLDCDPPRRLAFSWSAGPLVGTRGSFRLEPEGMGTRIFFEHAGFSETAAFGNQAFRGAAAGWAQMLGQLQTMIRRIEP